MNEILILYTLTKSQITMYGLSKSINKSFGAITKPGFGTIQPALKRMEKKGLVKSDKFFTDGGKPYFYYSITDEGVDYLKKKLLKKISTNPIQFIPFAKIKIACLDILSDDERKTLLSSLKTSLMKIKLDAEKSLSIDESKENYYQRMVLDSTVCEYNNFINLIGGLENACNR